MTSTSIKNLNCQNVRDGIKKKRYFENNKHINDKIIFFSCKIVAYERF